MPLQARKSIASSFTRLKATLAEAHNKALVKIFKQDKRSKEEKKSSSEGEDEDVWSWNEQHPDTPATSVQSEEPEPSSDPPAPCSTAASDAASSPTAHPEALPAVTEDQPDSDSESDYSDLYEPRLSIIPELEEPVEEKRKSTRKRASGGRAPK